MSNENSQPRFLTKDYASAVVGQMLLLSDSLTDLTHKSTKGTLREILVSGLLVPFLPTQFAVTSGVIVNVNGTQSRQTDVVIVDTRILPPFIYRQNVGVIPVESVVATIEVKSILSLKEIKSAEDAATRLLENVWPAHVLRQERVVANINPPLACVFGFTGRVAVLSNSDESQGKAWLLKGAKHLIAVVQARRHCWMLVNNQWSREEDSDSSDHGGIKRFVAVLADNCRRIAEWNLRFFANRQVDLLGRYIRYQSIDKRVP